MTCGSRHGSRSGPPDRPETVSNRYTWTRSLNWRATETRKDKGTIKIFLTYSGTHVLRILSCTFLSDLITTIITTTRTPSLSVQDSLFFFSSLTTLVNLPLSPPTLSFLHLYRELKDIFFVKPLFLLLRSKPGHLNRHRDPVGVPLLPTSGRDRLCLPHS